jgi:hypothetical protein
LYYFNRPVHTRSPHPSTATGNAAVLLFLHATLSTVSDTATHQTRPSGSGRRRPPLILTPPTLLPAPPQTFEETATVGDLQKWMVGPLASFVFRGGSFDDQVRRSDCSPGLSSGSPTALKRLSNGSVTDF